MKSFACALFVATACATIIEDKGDCKKTETESLVSCDSLSLSAVQAANRRGQTTPDTKGSYLKEGKAMLKQAMADDKACRNLAAQEAEQCAIRVAEGASTLMISASIAIAAAYLF